MTGAARPTEQGDLGSESAAASPLARGRLGDAVTPFSGRVSCHAPASRSFSIDAIARDDDGRDRWGAPGRRTAFLTSDRGVALAEFARHHEPSASADARRIVDMRLQAVPVLDLRVENVLLTLGCAPAMRRGFDRATARRLSAELRDLGICQGLIVPSMAFPDRPDRFNVILFCERLGVELGALLFDVEEVGAVRLVGG
jgi:hypothetical protein